MPWQNTMKLHGQTCSGCRVSLNCMLSLRVASTGRESCPRADCATTCMGSFTQGFKKKRKTTNTRGGMYPLEELQSFPVPHTTYYIPYKLV